MPQIYHIQIRRLVAKFILLLSSRGIRVLQQECQLNSLNTNSYGNDVRLRVKRRPGSKA